MSKALLITGATGKQGGAVINALLDANADFEILAVSRNAQSEAAQKLAQRSPKIKIVQGNLNNVQDVFKNAKQAISVPIWGVFSVQAIMGSGQNVQAEERQGKALVDESIKESVKFFVYSSVDRGGSKSFDNPTNVPHFMSKHRIERHLVDKTQSGHMDWTILRPTAFFDNLVPGYMGKSFATSLDLALKGKRVQLVAVSDIGNIAAKAFMNPEDFKGKALSLAGDDLTFSQMATAFKEKTGKDLPTTFKFICAAFLWGAKDMGSMFRWFREDGYGADIEELKRIYPNMKDFRTWLERDSPYKPS